MKKSDYLKFKILNLLTPKNFISGEKIAKNLGISRTAVWKHIYSLKNMGYPIEVSKKGYLLKEEKDILVPQELEFKLKEKNIKIVNKVYYFHEISSTMDFAKEIGEKGETAIIIAETQTKGRGRLQRTWHSPKGGIWISLVIKPNLSLKEAYLLTYIAGLSTAIAIEKITKIQTFLKWPNDVIYKENNKEKKLAGILLELKAEIDEIKYAIIGIGINANNEISSLEPQAISLKEILKKDINRKDIIVEIIKNFENFLNKPFHILELWQNKSLTIGRKVKIITPQEEIEGTALKVSEDGALVLKTKNELIKVYSGDCIHLRNI